MSQNTLIINTKPIGKGKERTCYLHPHDPRKLIKISGTETNIQTRREVSFYKTLTKRNIDYTNMPRYYGKVETNFGKGFVVDLITDYDGKISKSMLWYLEHGYKLSEFDSYLAELKMYFLNNLIIFNHDMYPGNLLLQKVDVDTWRLVVIDGIGDTVLITWPNHIRRFAQRKIYRRWDRFEKRLFKKMLAIK